MASIYFLIASYSRPHILINLFNFLPLFSVPSPAVSNSKIEEDTNLLAAILVISLSKFLAKLNKEFK
jgi:hypothetical protein